jgi:GTP cyclohydrolase I
MSAYLPNLDRRLSTHSHDCELDHGPASGHADEGVDRPRIERAIRELLLAIGEDPEREGLVETPMRAAKAWRDLTAGFRDTAERHLGKQFEHRSTGGHDIVAVRDVQFHSLCEHHLLPFFGRAHVAYLPANDRVCGLSKVARTVDVFARRLQMQERLTAQIADAIVEHLDPLGVAVILEGEHMCMRMRGASKSESDMLTTAFRGVFETDRVARAEITQLLLASRNRS